MQKEIILAKPRGFCAGVERAIAIVELAIKKYGAPVYVRHEIVHNKYVVSELKNKGVVFVEDLSLVPAGSILVFSAHGVSEAVEKEAQDKQFQVLDASCPLVKKVHLEAQKREAEGSQIILIGHAGHPEVEGTSGRVAQKVMLVQSVEDVANLEHFDNQPLSYVTQTTLSVDDTKSIIQALKNRFPHIQGPELKDICYATQNRQDAVKKLLDKVDMLLVIGSTNSSNSNRLKDLAVERHIPAYMIDTAADLRPEMFEDAEKIGITAGASAPETLLEMVLEKLETFFSISISTMDGVEENVKFKLPVELSNMETAI